VAIVKEGLGENKEENREMKDRDSKAQQKARPALSIAPRQFLQGRNRDESKRLNFTRKRQSYQQSKKQVNLNDSNAT
jgi:hypothetical protein